MKHIVNLVLSQPDHDFVSMRTRRHEKTYMLEARNSDEAILRATRKFKELGFYVHGASIVEQKAPEVPAVKQSLSEDVGGVLAAQVKQKIAQNKARAEVDKSEVQDKAGKAQAGSALAVYLKKKAATMKEEVEVTSEYLEEKLGAGDPASKWIHDFVHSDNPKFEGKSKAERIKMALGAKYAADRAVKEEAELEEGRAMDYKMSRSSVAGDRGDSKGGEINVSQKDREEIAKILGAKDDKKQDKKLEEAEQVEEGVKNNPDLPRKHTSWFVKPPKGARRFGKEFRMADKDKAEAHAMDIGGSVHKMDQYGSTMKEEVEQVEEAKADPVAKAKELLDQAEKGTYKGSAAKLQKALEKAKSRNFDQGKGYKLEEDAEQLDETGVVKKTNKTLKNVMAASKGAKINAAMGAAKMDPADYGYDKAQHLNKAIGRLASRGAAFVEEGAEGTAPKTPKEKELAAKAGDPNKITKKDVLAARGVKLDEVKGSYKDQATEKAEDERLAKKEAKDTKSAKAAETIINLAKSKKNKINTEPKVDLPGHGIGGGGTG